MPSWKKIILSGSEASLNSLNVTGPITGSDVQINGWGSVSASLASIESGATTQTLQDVTDNGNVTTNAITASAFVAGDPSSATTSFVYNGSVATLSQISNQASTLVINQRQTSGGILDAAMNFRRQGGPATWTAGLLGSDDSFTISRNLTLGSYDRFKLTNTGAEIISGSLYVENSITGSSFKGDGSAITGIVSASYALTSSYVATASYTPTLEQVTYAGNTTASPIIITGSNGPNDSLQINSDGFIISGSLVGGSLNRKTHEVTYGAVNFTANSTTTIAQLPAPKVAGFTFDYIAYVSGNVLQAGRAGVVKGILRNTETGGAGITKGFQINETTTLDLIDQGLGTAGLQFTIIQDTNGTSNQLVAIANNNWPYFVNYTLTIYYNPNFS